MQQENYSVPERKLFSPQPGTVRISSDISWKYSQSKESVFTRDYEASNDHHSGPAARTFNTTCQPSLLGPITNTMSGYHRRQDHQYCGSSPNHSSTHQPQDEAGVLWKKEGKTCLPHYQAKDQQQKIRYVAEKLNSDFQDRKKQGQCYPKRK